MTGARTSDIDRWGLWFRKRALQFVLACLVLQIAAGWSLPDAGPERSARREWHSMDFAMSMRDGRLEPINSGVWGDEPPPPPDVRYVAEASGEWVSASPPFFGWRWGEARTEFRGTTTQRLQWRPLTPAPDDLAAQAERVVGDLLNVPRGGARERGFGSLYDTCLPVRVEEGLSCEDVNRPEYAMIIAPWRLWLTSGLTALSFACALAAVVYVVRWVRLREVRAERLELGVCINCGYDRGPLATCPECGDGAPEPTIG